MKNACLYIILVFLLIIACKEPIRQEELIAEAVKIKMEQWRVEQREECIHKAIVDAEAFVDSLMVVNSLQTKLDTIPKPPKPNKPMKPSFKEKPDTVVVDPILKKGKED